MVINKPTGDFTIEFVNDVAVGINDSKQINCYFTLFPNLTFLKYAAFRTCPCFGGY